MGHELALLLGQGYKKVFSMDFIEGLLVVRPYAAIGARSQECLSNTREIFIISVHSLLYKGKMIRKMSIYALSQRLFHTIRRTEL